MKVLKRLSLLSGVAALVLAAFYVQASAAQQQGGTTQAQSQQRRTTQTNQRRNYRSYSYEPSRGGDVSRRASSPTWTRADSKVKFRYGYYPY